MFDHDEVLRTQAMPRPWYVSYLDHYYVIMSGQNEVGRFRRLKDAEFVIRACNSLDDQVNRDANELSIARSKIEELRQDIRELESECRCSL